MELQEPEHLPDGLASSVAILQDFESVRSLVIHERDRQIAIQRFGDEAIDHAVHMRELLLRGPHDQQGYIVREVVH